MFDWDATEIEEILARTANGEKYEPQRVVEVRDERGELVARVRKTLYVRKRRPEAAPVTGGLQVAAE